LTIGPSTDPVPWLHGVEFSGIDRGQQFQSAPSFMSGQIAEIELGTAAGNGSSNGNVRERRRSLSLRMSKAVRDLDPAKPGIYALRDEGGRNSNDRGEPPAQE
jgi:hypothetical protein